MKLLFGIENKGDNSFSFVRHKDKHGYFINTAISWIWFENSWISWGYVRHKLKYDTLGRRLNIKWWHS